MQEYQTIQPTLEEVAKDWPKAPQEALKEMIEKYGEPDEYSESQAIWHNNGPWRKSIVSREQVHHDFPAHHMDCLEQFIAYRVPVEKFDELARYDGSVIVERTKGLISARCAGEAMNFVAINLADDIVNGRRTVDEARAEYKQLYLDYKKGNKRPATQGFLFDVPRASVGDPDVATISKEEMASIAN